MPKPRKPGWGPVTLTISDPCALALRLLSVYSGQEMGVLADQAMRQGRLFDDLEAARVKGSAPGPAALAGLTPAMNAQAPEAHRMKPAGDLNLLRQLETLMEGKVIKQAELAKAVGITTALYRCGWRATGWVPAKYVPLVAAFLEGHGIEPVSR